MSTYTDLHNTLKETINVDYHSRKTNQVTKLQNDLNEYWGTFRGKIDANGSEISGSSLKDVIITDAVLCGNIAWEDKDFPVSKIVQSIKDLSDSLYGDGHGDIPVIKNDIVRLDGRIDAIGDTGKMSSDVTALISQTSAILDKKVNDEISVRYLDDQYLSSEISTVNKNLELSVDNINSSLKLSVDNINSSLKLSVDNINLALEDTNDRIDNVIVNYKTADKVLSSKIDNHIKENNEEFEKVYHTIQKDRHYDIYSVQTTSFPYQLKDFSVNRLEFRDSNGQMTYKGTQIGQIFLRDNNTISAFKTFDLHAYPELTQALESGKFYIMSISGDTPVENGFYIENYETSFVVKRAGSKYMTVLAPIPISADPLSVEMKSIGRVVSFQPDTEPGAKLPDVQSGNINLFSASDPIVSSFNIGNTYFDNSSHSTIVYPNNSNKIVYGGSNQLLFKFNCTTGHACYIKDSENVKFGMILSTDVIGKTPDQIEQFDVYVDGLKENKVSLLSSDDFFKESIEGKRIKYDKESYVLSVQDQITYEYTFDSRTGDYQSLSVRVADKNIHLSSRNFNNLEVDLKDVHKAFDKKTFTLTANEFKTEWRFSKKEEDLTMTLTYDGLTLTKSWENDALDDSGTVTYRCKNNSEVIVQSVNKISKPIDFVFNIEIDDPETSFYGNIDQNVWDYTASQIANIGITKSNNEPVKLYVPDVDKNGDLSALSREFLLTTKVYSPNKSKIEFKFFDPKGIDDGKSDVIIYNDKTHDLFVPTNNYYTYKFIEVKPNCFLVVDLNHHDISVDFENLSNELRIEKKTRYNDDQFISAQVSANTVDIADLYKQIHGGLVYKGALSLDVGIEVTSDIGTFRGLFAQNIKNATGSSSYEDGLSVKLRNGFYFISEAIDKVKKYPFDNVNICNGDLIIVKENTEVRDLTPEKLNIIDIMDHDAVHEDLLSAISVALSTDYYKKVLDLSTSLSTDIDRLSNEVCATSSDLQSQILSNDEDISGISSRVDELTSDLSDNIDYLSSEISSNDNDIFSISNDLYLKPNVLGTNGLSGKVDFLLSVGQNSMEYFGNAPKLDWIAEDRVALSDFLANFETPANYGKFFKQGFMFRLSAEQILSSKVAGVMVKLYENDYFIFNKSTFASAATSADINIIRDSQNEASALYDDLTGQIYQTSSYIIDTVEGLSNEVNTISNYLSSDYVKKVLDLSTSLSTDIDRLSNEVCATSSDLQDQILSNDGDIKSLSSAIDYVSSDLSTLEYDHYKKNISTDLSIYCGDDKYHNISAVVDQLLIVDEVTFLRYRLTIRNGALNISLVDDIKPHK